MPSVAPILAASDSVALAALPLAHGAAANGKAASDRQFSELFLDKTGPIELLVPKTILRTGKSDTGSDQPPASIAKPTASADKEEPDRSRAESLPSDSVTTVAQVSSQPLQTSLHADMDATVSAVLTEASASGRARASIHAAELTALGNLKPVQSPQPASSTLSTLKAPQQKNAKPTAKQLSQPVSRQAHPGRQSSITNTVIAIHPAPQLLGIPATSDSLTAQPAAGPQPALQHANSSVSALRMPSADGASASAGDPADPLAAHPIQSTAPDVKNAGGEAATPDGVLPKEAKESPESSEPGSAAAGSLAHPARVSAGPVSPGAPTALPANLAPAHAAGSGGFAAPPQTERPVAAAGPVIASTANAAAGPAAALYDKIDQGAATVVLHSGAQHIDIGVRDPDLGWLEIRAQNASGHVDAALVTASQQAHASLAAQLPAVADYLQQRDVRVGTLAVHHQMPGTGSGANSGTNAGSTLGSGSGGAGNSGSGAQNRPGTHSAVTPVRYSGTSPGQRSLQAEAAETSSLRPVSYISVRA